MKKLTILAGSLVCIFALNGAQAGTPTAPMSSITVPVDVSLLRVVGVPRLSAAGRKRMMLVNRSLATVNKIYSQANIKFVAKGSQKVVSVSKEDAAAYKKALSDKRSISFLNRQIRKMCPTALKNRAAICVIGNFGRKGQAVTLAAISKGRSVIWPLRAGNLNRANDGALAHQLGHVLGLSDLKKRSAKYLMHSRTNHKRSSGYANLLLTKREINRARRVANRLIGAPKIVIDPKEPPKAQ